MLRTTAVLILALTCSAVAAEKLSDKKIQEIAAIKYRGIGFSSSPGDLLSAIPGAQENQSHAGSGRGIITYEYRDDPAIDCVLLRFFDEALVEIQYIYFPIRVARMGGAKPITAIAVAQYGKPSKQIGKKLSWDFPNINRTIVVSEGKGQWSQTVFHRTRLHNLTDYPETTATPKENRLLVTKGRAVPDMTKSRNSALSSTTLFDKQSIAYRKSDKPTRLPTYVTGSSYQSEYRADEAGDLNLGIVVLVLIGILVYLFPAMIACNRGHQNSASITVVNVLFGWTLLGWGVALAWSLSSNHSHYSASKRICLRCGSQVGESMIRCPYCIHEVGSIDNHLSPAAYDTIR